MTKAVITRKRKDIDLSGRLLKHTDGLKDITNVNDLYLCNNQLQNVDGLRDILTVNRLRLHDNQLQNVDGLRGITTINTLSIYNNAALRISFLPPSLKTLYANVSQLSNFDFKYLRNLQRLYCDSTDRSRFRNLPHAVEVYKL